MEDFNQGAFEGPIAGAALTHELGSQPDERPPVFADPEDAYEDMANRLLDEEAFHRIGVAAELGVPVDLIVRSLVFTGWAEGQYTVDTMYLIYGPLFELTMAMLDEDGVQYNAKAQRKEDEAFNSAIDLLNEVRGDEEKDKTKLKEIEKEETEEPEEEEAEIPRGGLMGRSE